MVSKINEINNKNGLLKSVEIEARKRNYSVKNYHVLINKYADENLNRENIKIAERLQEAKPIVGTVS